MDHPETNPGISSAKSSGESVAEYKTSNVNENNSNSDMYPEKKAKPPPLDVNSTDDMLLGVDSGPKTPTSAPYATSDKMMQNRQKVKERKIGHRRVNEEGEITFKKIGTSVIMQSIQLGIGHAVGSLASKPERDLLMMDFTIVETTTFPPDGSNITPAHSFTHFKFKAYAPLAFRYFRDLFGIAPDDFLLSLCNQPMRELNNPGASGSIFYLTSDDEFIIKTVQKGEGEFLQKLLAGYFMNLNQNPRTLLPKFFGLYCYQCGGKNIRLIVMNNLLPSSIKFHEKYDLKGSTYKRKASKSERKKDSPTYKDLDFIERHPDGIFLEHDTYNALIKTMQRDCRVLESFKIMDYSLLVAIHNLDAARREQHSNKEQEIEEENAQQTCGQFTEKKDPNLARSKSMNKQRLAAFSTAMESIQAEVASSTEDKGDVPPGGIPAKNSKGEHLLLFLGIIDILQSYKLAKKLEHTLKSVLHDGDTVSVHRPGFYSNRFMQFMGKTVFKKMPTTLKHSPSKRKGISNKKGYADSKSNNTKIPAAVESTEEDDSRISSLTPNDILNDVNHVEYEKLKLCANEDSVSPRLPSSPVTNSIIKTNSSDKQEVISLSQVTFQTESSECISETSSSSTSGIGSSTLHTVAWTPPPSVKSTTPTHTEGTPSFTESSSSGDAACPTTPVQNMYKSTEFLPPLGETQTIEGCEVMKGAPGDCDNQCENKTRL